MTWISLISAHMFTLQTASSLPERPPLQSILGLRIQKPSLPQNSALSPWSLLYCHSPFPSNPPSILLSFHLPPPRFVCSNNQLRTPWRPCPCRLMMARRRGMLVLPRIILCFAYLLLRQLFPALPFFDFLYLLWCLCPLDGHGSCCKSRFPINIIIRAARSFASPMEQQGSRRLGSGSCCSVAIHGEQGQPHGSRVGWSVATCLVRLGSQPRQGFS